MTWQNILKKDLRQQAKDMKRPKTLREQGSKQNPPKRGSPEELEEINQKLRDKGLNV